MAKILKHFGLGNKKSSSSPVHKCRVDSEDSSGKSPRINSKKEFQTKDFTNSNNSSGSHSPLSPVKSPIDKTPDIKKKMIPSNPGPPINTDSPDDEVPVYSAVVKDRVTPDTILCEIASKLNIKDENPCEPLSTFGKMKNSDPCEKKSSPGEKLPDVIKPDTSSGGGGLGNLGEMKQMEYDDPYEEGPMSFCQPNSQSEPLQRIDSGMSSLKSSTNTLNQGRDEEDNDTLERPKKDQPATKCVGETQIGYNTLKSWNIEATGSRTGLEEDEVFNQDSLPHPDPPSPNPPSSDNDTLEGKPPPPLPAKTYNLNQDLPPPPPNFFNSEVDLSKPPPVSQDHPLDLSAKSPTKTQDVWSNKEENFMSLPPGPPPDPPARGGEGRGNSSAVDLRARNESLMMRSAYGLEGNSNNYPPYYHPPHHPMPPNRPYYTQQPQYPPQQVPPTRQNYRSGSVRSIDHRHEYEEPWDQDHPFFQTAPDGMRGPYNGQQVPYSPHYQYQYSHPPPHHLSRTSVSSTSSWSNYAPLEPLDPRLPLEEQYWFHGTISRTAAENLLRKQREGSYLVRMSESNKNDFSLSVKSARGFMHMKIINNPEGRYILGQFSQPFSTIPLMIHHYTIHKLPIKGAEHMSLGNPVPSNLM